jgi:O-acetyl-ADP-ribose deacetylase
VQLSDIEINIKVGNIAAEKADAIVNAANHQLWMGSGVAGAIKSAGGQSIEDEAIALGPIKPGEAVATSAGRLPAKWVIHAVAIDENMRATPELVQQATLSTLELAEKLSAAGVAFPALGAGVGGLTLPRVARAMHDAVKAFVTKRTTGAINKLIFVLFDVAAYNIFRNEFFPGKLSH